MVRQTRHGAAACLLGEKTGSESGGGQTIARLCSPHTDSFTLGYQLQSLSRRGA
ncbi:hypothetical protein J6590_103343, partial [Homalodisca vitripennis]